MSLPTFCTWLLPRSNALDLPGSGMKLFDDATQVCSLIYTRLEIHMLKWSVALSYFQSIIHLL